MADDFMQLIHRIRPSTQSLRWLTDYTNVTVRTQHAEGPVPGLRIEGMQSGRMFLVPFIMAQTVPHAFATPLARLQAMMEPVPTMREENTMEVDRDVEGRDAKPEETLPPPPPPKNTWTQWCNMCHEKYKLPPTINPHSLSSHPHSFRSSRIFT